MTAAPWTDDEFSFLAIGTLLLRNRWRIARWALLGGVIAALTALTLPPLYRASASFIPHGYDANQSGLASLAGQFGVSVSVPAGNQSMSPDFYASLVKSRAVLEPIAQSSFVVPELGGRNIPFLTLFEASGNSPAARDEHAIRILQSLIQPNIVKSTGVVEIAVITKWRSVSLAITDSVLAGVNTYNQRTRQGQAAVERKFVEEQLAGATADLRSAEDRLGDFIKTNRDIGHSPELAFQRDHLEREVSFRQQIVSSLTQSFEDAKIKEVRDTPVITMFEQPYAPPQAEPRGRVKRVLIGVVIGALLGALLGLLNGIVGLRRDAGNAQAEEFVGVLAEFKHDVSRPLRWVKRPRAS